MISSIIRTIKGFLKVTGKRAKDDSTESDLTENSKVSDKDIEYFHYRLLKPITNLTHRRVWKKEHYDMVTDRIVEIYRKKLDRLDLKDPFIILDEETKFGILNNKNIDNAIELYGDKINKYKNTLELTAKAINKVNPLLPSDIAFSLAQFSVKEENSCFFEKLKDLTPSIDISKDENKKLIKSIWAEEACSFTGLRTVSRNARCI